MGLDVVIGTLPDEHAMEWLDLYPLLQDCLRRAGLSPYHPEKKIEGSTRGRAYTFHDLAEYVRQEDWPVGQIRHLTCSQYQMIVPVDFIEPVPEFVEKSPSDYGLWIPKPEDLKEEKIDEETMIRNRWTAIVRFGAPSNGYHLGTLASDVYLLSAQQVSRECIDLLDLFEPDFRNEDFDWHARDLHPQANNLAHLFNCCQDAIRKNAVIWFSG